MKIYFIGQKGIPAKYGGVEKHVDELSRRLVKAGHEVYVYARPGYTDSGLKEHQGVKIISLTTIATKHLDTISHVWRACFDLRKRQVDLIHFHSIGPSSLIWLAKLIKPGVPVVSTFHTKCYLHKKWGFMARLYLRLGEIAACRLADATIVVSRSLENYARLKYKIRPCYIPNGAAAVAPAAPAAIKSLGLKKNGYILAVARLIRHKGIHYLIDAYCGLKTDKKLVIAGAGVYTDDYVKQLKQQAAGKENIIFAGNQTGRTLAELYSNAYLFVQTSESEGLSVALLEAMSYGRPVLVSDIQENLEAVAGRGFSYKNKDSGDLKNMLISLLDNPGRAAAKGKLARQRVIEMYNWDDIAEKTIKAYNLAIAVKSKKILTVKKGLSPDVVTKDIRL